MLILSPQEVAKRRKEAEADIRELLKSSKSDFTFDDVRAAIYDEEETGDMMRVVALFDNGQGASDLSTILETVADAWNYFPHKALGGKSPAEKALEYQGMSQKTQSIELTQEQYFSLLKIVYLGNWMANAHRDGSEAEPMLEEYEAIEDLMFSLAPRFGLERYMTHEESDGTRYFPSRAFEEESGVDELHEEYDNETFWDEFVERMGERDFHQRYSEKEVREMNDDEIFMKKRECVRAHMEEGAKYGLWRYEIKKDEDEG